MQTIPFIYESEDELTQFLEEPGSQNVSEKFAFVIKFGFLIQLTLFLSTIHSICTKKET